jgi:hypothetical protein
MEAPLPFLPFPASAFGVASWFSLFPILVSAANGAAIENPMIRSASA